ncbi:MAG: fibro-slime domain-containing protein [Polyangiaceae bacterium]
MRVRLFVFATSGTLLVIAGLLACGDEAKTSPFAPEPGPDASSDVGKLPPLFGDSGITPDANASDACGPNLTGILRDFKPATDPGGHPDFQYDVFGPELGIVAPTLGSDLKPVYNAAAGQIAGGGIPGAPNVHSTHGGAAFDQWYRDTPNVNVRELYVLPVIDENGKQVFDSTAFFPLDGKGFGNTGDAGHNFHFTFELHTEFEYRGGEVFKFRGDDDVWVFLNKKLAIDLGGIKGALDDSIDLDANAAKLGLTKGQVYALDFFFAERHTTESNFRLETTLKFVNCDPIIPK